MASSSDYFTGGDALLRIIDRGDEMMDYFVSKGVVDKCGDIVKRMKSAEHIASGQQGSVYVYSIDETEYVVKKTPNYIYIVSAQMYPSSKPISVDDLWLVYQSMVPEDERLTKEVMTMINGGNQNKLIRQGETFYTIQKGEGWPCKMEGDFQVETFYFTSDHEKIPRGVFTYPKNSYLCDNDSYTEYAIGMMCSNAFTKGKCANFIKMMGFSMCAVHSGDFDEEGNDIELYDYTFMERVTNDVKSLMTRDDLSHGMIDSVLIQTIFALSYMQCVLGIQHNDFHMGNVMFIDLDESYDVFFGGTPLNYADYFSYTIDGTRIYFKNQGMLIKIVDYGYAMKYSSPMIGRKDIALGIMETFPAWRDDYYDMQLFMTGFATTFVTPLVSEMFIRMLDPYSKLDNSSLKNLDAQRRATFQALKSTYTQGEDRGWRPSFTGLAKHPWEYLTDPQIMREYLKPPPEGSKIATLGVLNKSDFHKDFFDGNEAPFHLFSKSEIKNKLRH